MLKFKQVQKLRISMRALLVSVGSILLVSLLVYLLPSGLVLTPGRSDAAIGNAPTLSFMNPTLISGTAGDVNAVYLFPDVTSGVDAHVTLVSKYNSASLTDIDQLSSSTGYDPAFQPIIGLTAGTNGSPKTSYINWSIQFKKAGTNIDTTFQDLSATILDVDGTSSLNETIKVYNADSYSIDPVAGTALTISVDSNSVSALSPAVTYNAIDSANKTVMFQVNFTNVNTISITTGGINKSSFISRQSSVYFKPFFSNSIPLPVELTSFTAQYKHQKVVCNWSTQSEVNNDYFTLERSPDAEAFEELSRITGNGTSSSAHSYSYTDEDPLGGTSYYRLSQTDYDGHREYFRTVAVTAAPRDEKTLIITPNPFTNSFQVLFEAPQFTEVTIMVLSERGRVLFHDKMQAFKGINGYTFSQPDRLPVGTCLLKITGNNISYPAAKLLKRG
ncbi:MAG TPA: hypothetical protein VFW78_06585 [Bacteroidia bacterium]|nr:hypothetical protein [Bacteroidia bacterium]